MWGVSWFDKRRMLLPLAGLVALAGASFWARAAAAPTERSLAEAIPPHFEADAAWPEPLPPGKSLPELKPLGYGRPSVSVATGLNDHVWILQVPGPESRKAEAQGTAIPRLFEFD